MLPTKCHAAERADNIRPEIPQKNKNDTSMDCVSDKTALEDKDTQRVNAQQTIDMLEHNLQEHGKQTTSYTLRTTAVKDSMREKRRANCTHQCKECSEQSTQNPTEHPENSEDNQWTEVRSTKRGRNSPDLTMIRKQSKTNTGR